MPGTGPGTGTALQRVVSISWKVIFDLNAEWCLCPEASLEDLEEEDSSQKEQSREAGKSLTHSGVTVTCVQK